MDSKGVGAGGGKKIGEEPDGEGDDVTGGGKKVGDEPDGEGTGEIDGGGCLCLLGQVRGGGGDEGGGGGGVMMGVVGEGG